MSSNEVHVISRNGATLPQKRIVTGPKPIIYVSAVKAGLEELLAARLG